MTITVVRGGSRDRYGDPSTATPARVRLGHGWSTAPAATRDVDGRGRDGTIEELDLFGPAGGDVRRGDQVDVDGRLYEVAGEPERWTNPLDAWAAGIRVRLTRAVG